MYLVYLQTNWGVGIYFGGVYRSYERAEKRAEWLNKHCADEDNEGNDWIVTYVPSHKITHDTFNE